MTPSFVICLKLSCLSYSLAENFCFSLDLMFFSANWQTCWGEWSRHNADILLITLILHYSCFWNFQHSLKNLNVMSFCFFFKEKLIEHKIFHNSQRSHCSILLLSQCYYFYIVSVTSLVCFRNWWTAFTSVHQSLVH